MRYRTPANKNAKQLFLQEPFVNARYCRYFAIRPSVFLTTTNQSRNLRLQTGRGRHAQARCQAQVRGREGVASCKWYLPLRDTAHTTLITWVFFGAAYDFFHQVNLFFGTVSEVCIPQSCPTMSAGEKYARSPGTLDFKHKLKNKLRVHLLGRTEANQDASGAVH